MQMKTARISIDISEKSVKIIRTNTSGIITEAGFAKLPGGVAASGEARTDVIAQTIRSAAKEAKISGKENCVLVTGGPHIIVQQFVWPEMPAEALMVNAKNEISSFLPASEELFSISYKVIGRADAEDEPAKSEDAAESESGRKAGSLCVLVAAIPKDEAQILISAAKKAGFTPKTLDLRENARQKFAAQAKMKDLGKSSFAVLDVTDSLYNTTMFINGKYYANRYFNSFAEAPQTSDDGMPGDDRYSPVLKDADSLAAEVSSIIDYIHYRERGSSIEGIFVFGGADDVPGLLKNLESSLDIPVYSLSEKMKNVVAQNKRSEIKIGMYMDAYGASLVESPGLDLIPRKERVSKDERKSAMPVVFALLFVAAFIAASVIVPQIYLESLVSREKTLTEKLNGYEVNAEQVKLLEREVKNLENASLEAKGFSEEIEKESAKRVHDLIESVRPKSMMLRNFEMDNGVEKEKGVVNISGIAQAIEIVEFTGKLREIELFELVRIIQMASENDRNSRMNFSLQINLVAKEIVVVGEMEEENEAE